MPDIPELVVKAHRVGGAPACASVAAQHGLWMLHRPLLHIEATRGDSVFRSQDDASVPIRVRQRDDVVIHWVSVASRSDRMGQALDTALIQVLTCVPELDAICTVDSALHRGVVSRQRIAEACGPAAAAVLAKCDEHSESGTESVFRIRASEAGFVFRSQAEIPGGRVDFLFGDRLIVEVDGSEHHSGHEAFVADRERDAWHSAIGYYVVRLTYAQVVHRWHEVESLVRLLLDRGEHVWPPRIRNFM